MTPNSTSTSTSILENGRLKSGIYKIQNLHSETYLDIIRHSKELCCRPARDLEDGGGLWEIKSFGAGYTVQRVEPGKPEQFCNPIEGINAGTSIHVTPYPVAWRIEVDNEGIHRGFEYVRFHWGSTRVWDLHGGLKDDGNKVHFCDDAGHHPFQTWRLIPVNVEGVSTPSQFGSFGLGSLPPYIGGATGQSSAHTHHAEFESDDFGTVVTEFTTITTRKRYRVQDA